MAKEAADRPGWGSNGAPNERRDSDGASLLGGFSSEELLTTDACLVRAGGWGAYQWRLMLLLGAVIALVASHMLVPIFLMPYLQENAAWGRPLSTVQLGLIPTLFFLGCAIGVFFWGAVSDSRGRRPAIILSFAVGNTAGIASFFAPSFATFGALRFLCGFCIAGSKNGCFLLATEFAPPSRRAQVGALAAYAWLVGVVWLVGVAWLLQHRHWRWLALTYAPGLACQALMQNGLPESPRYSLVAGDVERARLVLGQVFRANGVAPPEPLTLKRPPSTPPGAPRSTFSQLCRRGTRRATLLVGLCQGICTLTFYAITFDSRFTMTSGDLYLGALLGALVELPAYMMLERVTNSLGRRLAYSMFLLLSACCLLALYVATAADDGAPPLRPAARPAGNGRPGAGAGAGTGRAQSARDLLAFGAVLGGRFSSVAAVNVAYIFAAELFPTSCRNSGIGWATGCGRLGAMVAPALMYDAPKPLLVFTGLCATASALVWLLPESAGGPLADVLAPQSGRAEVRAASPSTPKGSAGEDGER